MTMYPDEQTPFPEVAGVAVSYFHPDTVDEQGFEDLRRFAAMDPIPDWFGEFKAQMAQVLEQNLDGLDVEEFDREVQPSARTTEIFIRRMWAIIFPEEPIPGSPSGPFDAIYTIIDTYFQDREPGDNHVHPDYLARQLQRPEVEQTPLLRAIKPELTRLLQGDFDGLRMREFRSLTSAYYFHLREDDKDFARHVWHYLFPDEPLPEN